MNLVSKLAPLGCLCFAFTFYSVAQTAPVMPCALDAPVIALNSVNIFNDQQEQDLGDAFAEYFESEMRIAPPAADDQLTRLGEKLLATLPPTTVHYSFRVYESGEINAFSIAGGHVYVSRKLIAAVKNEDELAGVLAHEIGHIRTHQVAIDVTNILRVRLGVTGVTDRADIFARVHQFLSTPAKSNEESESEEKHEVVADQMALYAMVRAGYAAESFPAFFNQISDNKGKTGNWLTDKFGLTHENAQRYRAALKLIAALPEGCKGRKAGAGPAFSTWQRGIVENRVKTAADGIDGDRPLPLDPPIQPSLWRIRFSPDGLYILAQDESGIAVIDKTAAKAMFRIDAPDVEAADFSPDSKSIVFHDRKLRVERWGVADGKRISVRELVVVDSCFQTMLTPDGHTLVCAFAGGSSEFPHMGVRLIDVESGNPYFEKPNFFEPGAYSEFSRILSAFRYVKGVPLQASLVNMLASPDGKFLLLAAADRILAWDLERREAISLGGGLKKLYQNPMTFLSPHQLFEVGEWKKNGMFVTRMFSFPDGQQISESEIGAQRIEGVSKGDNLIVGPLKDYPVGIFDPVAKKVLEAAKLPSIDAWEKTLALENGSGGVSIGQMGATELKRIQMPTAQLLSPRAAVISPDGKYLALSMKNRAMIWNLETGKQVKMTRPFNSAWIDSEDRLFGQFPKYIDREPVELRLSISTEENKTLGKFETEDFQQRDLQFRFKPIGKDIITSRHATLEVKKMETQTVAWKHDYPQETPAIWPAEDNRLVLAWDLSNDAAKLEIKNNPVLQKQEEAFNNHKKGLLIETVDPESGALLEQVIIPEIDLTGGWEDSRRATVSGRFVLAQGEHGNTVIYRIQDGAKVGEFFGLPLATNAEAGIIAAVNRETEMLLVDEHSGKELNRFNFASPVRMAHIVNNKEKMLLVLTADQVMHRIPLPVAEKPSQP